MQTYLALAFCCTCCQKLYFMMPGVFIPTQLQVEDRQAPVPPDKILISQGRLIPALILDKGAVASKIHGHRRATYRTSRNQPSGNLHIFCQETI